MQTSKSLNVCADNIRRAWIRNEVRLYCGMQIENKGLVTLATLQPSAGEKCQQVPFTRPVAHKIRVSFQELFDSFPRTGTVVLSGGVPVHVGVLDDQIRTLGDERRIKL